ncbi:MAG: hypothetical protein RI885_2747 [Actinomycetota bacterium]|jgi:methylase of polypeptide subunit release factors
MALTGGVTQPSLLDSLRVDLRSAVFTVESLIDLWGRDAAAALQRGDRVPAARALRALRQQPIDMQAPDARAARSTLAGVFVLGLPTDAAALAAALPSLGVPGAVGLGLVAAEGSLLVPLMHLHPYGAVDGSGVVSWWIASDLGESAVGGPLRVDHVLGVGGASSTLSGLMIGEPVDSALDLGTGCGIQAMHAARHARRVVATDISERALFYAAMNAELNGIRSIEFRLGSLFEPVAGERFDQIVSNPPFVVTPRGVDVPMYEYRDGGMAGDSLLAAVVSQVADHLTVGGTAQLLGNWEHHPDADGLDRVATWVAEGGDDDANLDAPGLDLWAIERDRQDPALYAATWIRDGGRRGARETEDLTGLWLDDFEARSVTAVGFGYLLLRRGGGGLRRLERLDGALGHNATGLGAIVAAGFAAHDRLAATSDDALFRSHLAVASDVTEHRHYWPGDEHPTVMTLQQGGGFGRAVALDTELAAFVGACDGDLPAGAISDAIADLLQTDAAALRLHLLPSMRELVLTGFLLITS